MTKSEDENADEGGGGGGRNGVRDKFEELCQDLNMDESTVHEAWAGFEKIRTNFTLEGDELHWLACALYVACRKTLIPTVGRGTLEGNCVSLTRILRSSKLRCLVLPPPPHAHSVHSLIAFFGKMKKWGEMAQVGSDFRCRIERLERNFAVSTVIFKKLEPIFLSLFRDPQDEAPRQPRGRKQRRLPCTVSDLFKFCWTLFVRTKANFPMISDDLVNSYHLLLCCLDLMYGNALLSSHRKDLLNPNFQGLPEEFGNKDFRPPAEPPCIIDQLCVLHDGIVLEAKGIKEHYWKPYVRKLFERKILKGKIDTLSGFLDVSTFTDNEKAINREYEEYVLTVGDFDERVFLGEDADEELGTPQKGTVMPGTPGAGHELAEKMKIKRNLQQHFEKTRSLAPSTPLTGRRYLKEKEQGFTPVSTATQSVGRLQSLLSGLRGAPSENLLSMLRSSSRDQTEAVQTRVREMGATFCKHYTGPSDGQPGSHIDFAQKRLKLAEILYYKVLEGVITQEKKRVQGKDLTTLLEQDVFHRSLMACCLEIVLFSYNSQRTFPWILDTLSISPYSFYKVIEVLIRAEEGLSRDMVKHLNHVEETVLESLAWRRDSPLWDALHAAHAAGTPSCEEVTLPNHLESIPAPAIIHPRVREVRTDACPITMKVAGDAPQSPFSAHDRYSSPAAGTARRKLFTDSLAMASIASSTSQSSSSTATAAPSSAVADGLAAPAASVLGPRGLLNVPSVTPLPGHTMLTVATATVTATNGQSVTIPVRGITSDSGTITFVPVTVNMSGGHQPTLQATQLLSQTLTARRKEGPALCTAPAVTAAADGEAAAAGAGTIMSRPKRTGSLALFFRKVYHLASVRLRDLCQKLDVSPELRSKVWTCFEHSLVHCTNLMADRHLDQLLMCAIYVMAKVTKSERSFQDIMKWYRSQPQANSHVYRSVLLKGRRRRRNSGSSEGSTEARDRGERESSPPSMRSSSTLPVPHPSSAPPTPTRLLGSSCHPDNEDEEEEERGDLIQFYNQTYISCIRTFALKYTGNSLETAREVPPLSPLPLLRTHPCSPRRVSHMHPIYVSPHKNGAPFSPRSRMLYCFNQSPSRNLRQINSMISCGEGGAAAAAAARKRSLPLDDGPDSPAKRPRPDESVWLRRLQDVASERVVQ
ncbi:retinoblastoma-like protein 1 isoform X1 [Lethenteron reissneri]|uniref:retinoblastoma-like protein 1 isoform X1 n=1 Tax=Lethenteron reissneri TaxID=7753 RepID=UPI002AB68DCB|nr:retinoblastoma-like protein 1 isoform X1 [Lethenteron reissneri]